jgi:hypothetical protein
MALLKKAAAVAAATAALVAIPSAAHADAYGCNYFSCISVTGNASAFKLSATGVAQGGTLYGHFHIWGPNVDYSGPDQYFNNGIWTPLINGYGAGKACAEFWYYNNGQYESTGLACEEIS